MVAPRSATTLADLIDDFLAEYTAAHPAQAAALGLPPPASIGEHSPAALIARLARYRALAAALHHITPQTIDEQLDCELLRWQLEWAIWQLGQWQPQRHDPRYYVGLVFLDPRRARSTDAVEQEAVLAELRAIPGLLETARANLRRPLSRLDIEEALIALQLNATTLSHEHLPTRELRSAARAALTSLAAFSHFLQVEHLPAAVDEVGLGREHFIGWLRFAEQINLAPERLRALGEAEIRRQQDLLTALAPNRDYRHLLRALAADHPPSEQILDELRAAIAHARNLVARHALVSLIDAELPLATVAPPFARWATLSLIPPGRTGRAEIAVSLPDPTWPTGEQAAWLRGFGRTALTIAAFHEAYPGHYLHLTYIAHAPGRLARHFWSSCHLEGWAHYSEQIALAAEFGERNPHLLAAVAGEALLRACRLVVGVELHTGAIDLATATERFRDEAGLDPLLAQREARRSALDPAVICYTLGRLTIERLGERMRQRWKETFSLQRFHDTLLSFGAPPLPVLNRLLKTVDML
ncbi:DUF885 family protein [Chloroflexus sp.]|uniref:DUF885 family protein n=1 Tax=Chloroflexus sp. TaxID=1904827 RepID=UPI002602BEB6|nr:DUF885 family protein [uncultured Chloroflexus sp.]